MSAVRGAALALGYLAIWSVAGRYYGLKHDAQIYVLQAIAKLNPEVFNGDLYLRFGSQDDFTLFSNLSAGWIALLGIDYGAAALTIASIVAWIISAWLLTRRLVGSAMAWAAIGLLLNVPAWYGPGQVFQLVERFLNARLPAEAACLLALAALIHKRFVATGVCFTVALVIHPLMTTPCIAVAAVYLLRASGRGPGLPTLTLSLACATLVAAGLLGFGSPLIMGDWLAAVRSRSGHIFLDTWTLIDWQLTLLPLVTVAIAARTLRAEECKQLASAAACVAVAGFLAAAFVTWGLPVRVALQIQPWRWAWIATFLALALLIPTLSSLWQRKSSGRACALLLTSAWLLCNAPQSGQWIAAASCIVAVTALGVIQLENRIPTSTAKLLLIGGSLVLVCTAAWLVSLIEFETAVSFDFGGDPFWVQRLSGVLKIPPVAAVAVLAAWFAVMKLSKLLSTVVVATAGLVLLFAAAPGAWAAWSARMIDARAQHTFGEWRTVIGPQQEVLWPEGLQWTWFAVGRRSYLTISQLSGIVFSEDTAIEARRRAKALAGSFPAGVWFNEAGTHWPPEAPATADGIAKVCSTPGVDYYISATDVGRAIREAEWPTKGMHVYLYDCGRLRRQADP